MRKITTLAVLTLGGMYLGSAAAQQQLVGSGQFCVRGASDRPIQCEYQTREQCQQARPAGQSDQCVSRSEAEGTVGGATSSAPRERSPVPGEQKD